MSDADLIAELKAEAQGPFEQHAVELVEGMLKRRAAVANAQLAAPPTLAVPKADPPHPSKVG